MKAFGLLLALLASVQLMQAQISSPIPLIGKHLTDYFIQNPHEQIRVATNLSLYHPGEKIWFSVTAVDENNRPSLSAHELFVKLYSAEGKSISQQLFKFNNGYASCDLTIPPELKPGNYFLCVYTSSNNQPDLVSTTRLRIDPQYNNQWIASGKCRDSISIAGKKNEFSFRLKELSGAIKKNTAVLYQITNGSKTIDKGKIKTDKSGEAVLPFILPEATTGDPFFCQLNDNRDEWEQKFFLPSNLDSIKISFFPEGGNLVQGIPTKIGITAFNKWGIPIPVDGVIIDSNGKEVVKVKTFSAGLGLFTLLPEENQSYKLQINNNPGLHQQFLLPEINKNGLSLSIIKNDAEFISANLQMAAPGKHQLALAVTRGSNINWAADFEINKANRLKIPVKELPQGINSITVFSPEGKPLAERLIYIEKKELCKVTILPEKETLSQGEITKIKLSLTDELNNPITGKLQIAVSDCQRLISGLNPPLVEGFSEEDLVTPFSLIAEAVKGRLTNTTLVDIFLISNHFKWFEWNRILLAEVSNNQPASAFSTNHTTKGYEDQLISIIRKKATGYQLTDQPHLPDSAYYQNNGDIFIKAPKNFRSNAIAYENQQKMFASSTSILDVIKSIKPFKITNNQIVFIGSENSFNYQGGALIILDGQQLGTDVSALSSISPMDIDHINVSTNPMDIQRYTGLNSVGIIEIFQKRAVVKTEESTAASADKYENGYRIPGTFPPAPANARQDFRPTLLWISGLETTTDGKAEFTLKAGSITSDFIVKANVLTNTGKFGQNQITLKISSNK